MGRPAQTTQNARRYYTQKNHQRLLGMDREMRVKRMYLERSIPELSHSGLPQEVTIPVVVHLFYKSGSDTLHLPTGS